MEESRSVEEEGGNAAVGAADTDGEKDGPASARAGAAEVAEAAEAAGIAAIVKQSWLGYLQTFVCHCSIGRNALMRRT